MILKQFSCSTRDTILQFWKQLCLKTAWVLITRDQIFKAISIENRWIFSNTTCRFSTKNIREHEL